MTAENLPNKKKIPPVPMKKPWNNGTKPVELPKNPECMKRHDKRDGRK